MCYFLCIKFFFVQGWSQRDLEAFIDNSGIIEGGPQEVKNYKQVQTICTTDPKARRRSAVRSSSITTASEKFAAAKHITTGDETTWGEVPRASCSRAKRPPTWHKGQEVEHHLESPAGGS